ncbi:hypothetical protein FHG87_018769 [Trinorchestia longiramus]|nr:hypothetical protein FHG87_018769 [Trinorchestia longiramus]
MDEGMVIAQGDGNGLLENGRVKTVNAIIKVLEWAQKKNVRVAVTSLLKRPACDGEYEWLHNKTLMQGRVMLVCKENQCQIVSKGCGKWQMKSGRVGLIVKNALN